MFYILIISIVNLGLLRVYNLLQMPPELFKQGLCKPFLFFIFCQTRVNSQDLRGGNLQACALFFRQRYKKVKTAMKKPFRESTKYWTNYLCPTLFLANWSTTVKYNIPWNTIKNQIKKSLTQNSNSTKYKKIKYRK